MIATRGPSRYRDPDRVGDIQIESRLGAGGMSVVYKGRTQEGQPVAVKVLRHGLWTSPESRATLTRQARAIGSIESPHVAKLLASDVEGEHPYLVLELVEGKPLNKAVPDGGFDTDTASLIAQQILEGLDAAHDAGVVHLDLKPSNILLSNGWVKLIDFGVAAIANPGTQTSLTPGTNGEGSETMAWLAPEQIHAAAGTAKSDIFRWGLVAHYAATGRNPFGSGRPEAVMYSIVNDEPDLGRLDRQLGDAILSALSKDPDARPTASQLQAMFGKSANQPSASQSLPAPLRPTTPSAVGTGHSDKPKKLANGRRTGLLVSLAVALSVILGGVGVGVSGWVLPDDATPGGTESESNTAVQTPSFDSGPTQTSDASTAEEPLVGKLGESMTLRNGLIVATSVPAAYSPNADSYPEKPGWGVNISITNGTKKAALRTAGMYYSASAAGHECEEIWDDQLDGAPNTPTLQGKSTVFSVAFACPKAKAGEDIVLSMDTGTYDSEHDEFVTIFSGTYP